MSILTASIGGEADDSRAPKTMCKRGSARLREVRLGSRLWSLPIGVPLADELIQLPDEAGQRAAISMNQNSGYSSKIVSTNEEVLPDAVLIEPSELNTTNSSALENVARLAKLYAMGTPSEKEFQRLKGLISQSLRNSQAPI
jgi:hypothetical protein